MGSVVHLQQLHGVGGVAGVWRGIAGRIPEVQRSPPQTHLHVPGTPAVLPVLVGRGGMQLGIPQVSEERRRLVIRGGK